MKFSNVGANKLNSTSHCIYKPEAHATSVKLQHLFVNEVFLAGKKPEADVFHFIN